MGANKKSNFQKCGNILIDITTLKSQLKTCVITCGFCDAEYDQVKIFSQHLEEQHSNHFDTIDLGEATEPENNSSLATEQEATKIDEQPVINVAELEKTSSFALNEGYENPLDSGPSLEIRNAEEIIVTPLKREYDDSYDDDEEYWDPQRNKRFHNSSRDYSDDEMDTIQKANDYANQKEYTTKDEIAGNSRREAFYHSFTASEDFNNSFTNPQFKSISQSSTTTLEPSTINHQNALHNHLPKSEEITNQVVAAIQPMLTRLTNELQTLRNEVHEIKKDNIKLKCAVMPAQPFEEIEIFLDFEKKLLENGDNFALLENELTAIAKAPNFTKNCWRKLITDELGEQLCWKGTETKKSVRNLSTTKAIRNAALSVGITEDQFIKDTRTFFQFAKNRIKLRREYKIKKI